MKSDSSLPKCEVTKKRETDFLQSFTVNGQDTMNTTYEKRISSSQYEWLRIKTVFSDRLLHLQSLRFSKFNWTKC